MKSANVAVAGATGAVGTEMIRTLEQRDFAVKTIRLLASERSVGKKLKFRGQDVAVEKLTRDSFKGIDIALFSAGASRSLEFCPAAAGAGAAPETDPRIPRRGIATGELRRGERHQGVGAGIGEIVT